MYCRSCKTELADGAVACTGCGKAPLNGAADCFQCGADTGPDAVMCVKCGTALGNTFGSGINLNFDSAGVKGNRTVIGIVAILLGSLGIHKFMLGYTQEGIIMLVVTIAGSLFLHVLGSSVMGIIGIIEGIISLTKTDQQFYDTYVAHKKAWF